MTYVFWYIVSFLLKNPCFFGSCEGGAICDGLHGESWLQMFYPWSLWPCCILFGQWPAILQTFIWTIHFDESYRLSSIFQQFVNEHLAAGGILFYTSCINGTVLSLVPRASCFFVWGFVAWFFGSRGNFQVPSIQWTFRGLTKKATATHWHAWDFHAINH